ncbi:hypothetical protein HA45_04960 [Pantoea rodasii]|nr:hypothetical protein HA45_04960 [Pantoea rodasii]
MCDLRQDYVIEHNACSSAPRRWISSAEHVISRWCLSAHAQAGFIELWLPDVVANGPKKSPL